jgi:hypothetical protein
MQAAAAAAAKPAGRACYACVSHQSIVSRVAPRSVYLHSTTIFIYIIFRLCSIMYTNSINSQILTKSPRIVVDGNIV